MVVCDILLFETGIGNRAARKHITLFVQYLMAFGDDGSENLSDIFFPLYFPPFFPLGSVFLMMHFENFVCSIFFNLVHKRFSPHPEEGSGVGRDEFGGK